MSQNKARPVGILTPIGLILCLMVWCSPRLSAAPVVMVEKSESAVIAPFVPPPPAKPSLVAVILSKLNPTSPTAALGEQKLTEQRLFVLKSGESLQSILAKANIESRDIDKAISSLNRTYDLRNLPVGTPIAVETIADQPTERQPREAGKGPAAPLPRQNLIAISFTPNIKNEILVTRETWLPPATVGQNPLQGGPVPEVKFVTSTKPRSLSHHLSSVTLTIQTSLYEAGERKAVPTKVMAQAIHLLSWDVDFQRDIQSGNQLRIIYDDYRPNGSSKGSVQMRPIGGEVYGLELTLSNRKVKIYRYQAQNGKILYLDEKGQGLAKALMRTPINGGRLTSRFGMRKNPVLGYTAMHKGIDFGAAPEYANSGGRRRYRHHPKILRELRQYPRDSAQERLFDPLCPYGEFFRDPSGWQPSDPRSSHRLRRADRSRDRPPSPLRGEDSRQVTQPNEFTDAKRQPHRQRRDETVCRKPQPHQLDHRYRRFCDPSSRMVWPPTGCNTKIALVAGCRWMPLVVYAFLFIATNSLFVSGRDS